MNCPVCKLKLTRKFYEEVIIHQCDGCLGTLIKFERLKTIETRRDKSEDELMDELANATEDSLQKLRCSHCLSNMEKRRKKIGVWEFAIDRCNKCKLVWLDSGELAKLQVIYESSEQGVESERFRNRLETMSPEEKEEYEQRISDLPEENFAKDVIQGIVTDWRLGGRYWWLRFW